MSSVKDPYGESPFICPHCLERGRHVRLTPEDECPECGWMYLGGVCPTIDDDHPFIPEGEEPATISDLLTPEDRISVCGPGTNHHHEGGRKPPTISDLLEDLEAHD